MVLKNAWFYRKLILSMVDGIELAMACPGRQPEGLPPPPHFTRPPPLEVGIIHRRFYNCTSQSTCGTRHPYYALVFSRTVCAPFVAVETLYEGEKLEHRSTIHPGWLQRVAGILTLGHTYCQHCHCLTTLTASSMIFYTPQTTSKRLM